ncbi:MAG TPA: hypothetical protein DCR93_31895 [Cytophagales bacterium]|nr:hypothetical protein [Cytophagales bacterium]HAP63897.1 hypothetical protein [Cytophagales bacterium]
MGYRIKQNEATAFRQWATEVLHEYIIQGCTMDEVRLEQLQPVGQHSFDRIGDSDNYRLRRGNTQSVVCRKSRHTTLMVSSRS